LPIGLDIQRLAAHRVQLGFADCDRVMILV
jgi:hypothetical protein